MKAKFE